MSGASRRRGKSRWGSSQPTREHGGLEPQAEVQRSATSQGSVASGVAVRVPRLAVDAVASSRIADRGVVLRTGRSLVLGSAARTRCDDAAHGQRGMRTNMPHIQASSGIVDYPDAIDMLHSDAPIRALQARPACSRFLCCCPRGGRSRAGSGTVRDETGGALPGVGRVRDGDARPGDGRPTAQGDYRFDDGRAGAAPAGLQPDQLRQRPPARSPSRRRGSRPRRRRAAPGAQRRRPRHRQAHLHQPGRRGGSGAESRRHRRSPRARARSPRVSSTRGR